MKRLPVRITSHLPTVWPKARGMLAQGNVRVNPTSKLRAKVIVFDTQKSLRRFWKRYTKHDLGRGCLGAVNSLAHSVIKIQPKGSKKPETEYLCLDAKYFCVIGLLRGHTGTRVICHESVHAAFAYIKRRVRNHWDRLARENDEEEIAYPTGEIARGIVIFLNRHKL